ncbi:MAG: 8-amino-7-oxononanoate synthase [Dehalococcoidia bacterium]|nr:8-amino-7-oxononanoate synthase [Dehalococcoidia bacterium]MDZ4246067.1 8-amino-7-oxononanoate synthase [Dehalococcoidia bacterium]
MIQETRLNNDLRNALSGLASRHMERKLKVLTSQQGSWVEVDNRKVLNLCSNNYLDLATHPRVKNAAAAAIEKYGCGSGASRLICGNTPLQQELERRLASFKGKDAALLYPSGYAANLGAISCLAGPGDHIFSDELNHASIIDGSRLSRAAIEIYPHKNLAYLGERLENTLRASPSTRRLIVTDAVFSMDGDTAPLPGLVELAERFECTLMVDEAHATGALGPGGKGLVSQFGLEEKVPVIMGTLSKALGSLGGFIAGSRELAEYLVNNSRSFIFSTALPPPSVAAALESLTILEESPSLPEKLLENASYIRDKLTGLGFNTGKSTTQIVPVITGDPLTTSEMAQSLLRGGVWCASLRPPSVPEGGCRLRLSPMATHTREDLDFAVGVIKKTGRSLGII